MGIFDRALKYLLNLQYGSPVRRLNWSMTVRPRLDISSEQYHVWGPDRNKVRLENVGEYVHLRVELQALWRLPRSNAIAFSIRTYLMSLQELATVPGWAGRLRRVLENLRPELVEYKGLTRYRQIVVDWLSQHDCVE